MTRVTIVHYNEICYSYMMVVIKEDLYHYGEITNLHQIFELKQYKQCVTGSLFHLNPFFAGVNNPITLSLALLYCVDTGD